MYLVRHMRDTASELGLTHLARFLQVHTLHYRYTLALFINHMAVLRFGFIS